jgi:competence/damage-inducible protein CinA-like protein
MKAEIISIGDEILIGQIVNSNAAWMGQELNKIGIEVVQISTISDQRQAILDAMAEAARRAELIVITGGLGPTKDDITKECLCEYFDTELLLNQDALKAIEKLFKNRGFSMTPVNCKQAELPATCQPIENSEGTAQGMWFENDGKVYISMPGVPFEMKAMMAKHILPRLKEKYSDSAIVHKTIMTQGVGESWLADQIADWENALPKNIKLAYLPQPGIVRLRLSAYGDDDEKLTEQVNAEVEKVKTIIQDLIFGYDDDSLENVLGQLLKEKGQTMATAESCTGGYIAHLITSIAGSSAYFIGSLVSYANEIKVKELGVEQTDLDEFGAVSEQVVRQMAEGVRQKFNTDFAIATSGIAGPDGGTEAKPVGTIWIAIAGPEKTIAKKFMFGEHRGRNIRKTALQALNMLRKEIG